MTEVYFKEYLAVSFTKMTIQVSLVFLILIIISIIDLRE